MSPFQNLSRFQFLHQKISPTFDRIYLIGLISKLKQNVVTDFLKENNESSVIANKWLNHGWIFRPLLFLININDLSDN